MSEQDWKSIWNRDKALDRQGSVLQQLLMADGFDSSTSKLDETTWLAYCDRMERRLFGTAGAGGSLYDVGCGSGAFLYPFARKGYRVGGLDYSERQIALARQVMPEGEFSCGEAWQIPSGVRADWVVSNGVFLYFPDLAYAGRVCAAMVGAALRGVAILEVPDATLREAAEADRRASLPAGEYEKKYAGLGHLYYAQDWFREQARRHGLRCAIHSQTENFSHYGNAPFRYNVLLWKA